MVHELKCFNVDTAALSKTRRVADGQLREHVGGCTIYWKGLAEEECHIHGVGFTIKNELIGRMSETPIGISERLMTICSKLSDNSYATIVSTYGPTLMAEDEVKEHFYSQLDYVLRTTSATDKLVLLGDFNAGVGREPTLWNGVIGKEDVGRCNTNGTLLLTMFSEHSLVTTNTLFRQRNKHKISWKHSRSGALAYYGLCHCPH